MQRWEYMTLTAKSIGYAGDVDGHSHWEYVTEKQLDQAGEEGWEAVSASFSSEEDCGMLGVLLKRLKLMLP